MLCRTECSPPQASLENEDSDNDRRLGLHYIQLQPPLLSLSLSRRTNVFSLSRSLYHTCRSLRSTPTAVRRLYGARGGGKREGGCCGWSFHDPPSPDDRLAPSHTPHAARQILDPLASTAHTSRPRSALSPGADPCVRVVQSGNGGGPVSFPSLPPTPSIYAPPLSSPPFLPRSLASVRPSVAVG